MTDERNSPPASVDPTSARSLRRQAGGARVNLSRPVTLIDGARTVEGWALNISRGGIRVLVEDTLAIGENWELQVGNAGETGAIKRRAVVRWAQNDHEGTIAGLEFLDGTSISSMTMRAVAIPIEPQPGDPPATIPPPEDVTVPIVLPIPPAAPTAKSSDDPNDNGSLDSRHLIAAPIGSLG